MPFVQGESLRARIEQGPFSLAQAISVLREVAKALAYAHENGVVHRDIKPDNVLLSGDTAVVTDFGMAKAAIVGIGLPSWVLPGALMLVGAALPVILAGVTSRRTWQLGGAAAALFVLSIAGFMTLRAMGIGPAGSLLGKGLLRQNDRVVIAQFTAQDTSLGGSVSDALRTELSQSRVVTVLQPSVVTQTLVTMQRPENTPVDATLAREVAQNRSG